MFLQKTFNSNSIRFILLGNKNWLFRVKPEIHVSYRKAFIFPLYWFHKNLQVMLKTRFFFSTGIDIIPQPSLISSWFARSCAVFYFRLRNTDSISSKLRSVGFSNCLILLNSSAIFCAVGIFDIQSVPEIRTTISSATPAS